MAQKHVFSPASVPYLKRDPCFQLKNVMNLLLCFVLSLSWQMFVYMHLDNGRIAKNRGRLVPARVEVGLCLADASRAVDAECPADNKNARLSV